MRRRRTSASMSVWSSAWRMCSVPVTLGGGITIENGGAAAAASAVNRPRSSQNRYRRPSTSAGAYCGAISVGCGAVTPRSLVPRLSPAPGNVRHAKGFPPGITHGSFLPSHVRVIGEQGEQKERRRGLVPRAPAIVRRLLPHRLALAAAAVTVALAATLLAAFASFSATVSANAVRTSLAGNPGTTVSVTASVTSAAGATLAGGTLAAALRRALPGLPVTVWSAASSDYLDIPPGRGLPHAETHVISLATLA